MATNPAVCKLPSCPRPRFKSYDGTSHGYCGRTHAAEAVKLGFLPRLLPPHGSCHECGLDGCHRTVHFEQPTGRVHDFCCRRHAKQAKQRQGWPPKDCTGSTTCRLSDCDKPVYHDPRNGRESDYCSRSHLAAGRAQCQSQVVSSPPLRTCSKMDCSREPWVERDVGTTYCSSRCARAANDLPIISPEVCGLPGCVELTLRHWQTQQSLGYCCKKHEERASAHFEVQPSEPNIDRAFRSSQGPKHFLIGLLSTSHEDYESIKQQFLGNWVKSDPAKHVTLKRIFKLQVPQNVIARYLDYRRTKTNVRRRFHGTSSSPACSFFVDLRGGPCCKKECNVCNICENGFKFHHSGDTARKTGVSLRYGKGFYFSSISGKANDYARRSEKVDEDTNKVRIMFLVNVVVGRAFKTTEGRLPPEKCPPEGYDSVVGEAGKDLNYNEVVVYKEEALRPTHIVAYIVK